MKKQEILFSGDPVQDLLNAVVVQAAEDYREAYINLVGKPGNRKDLRMLEETELFFLSPYFGLYTTADGKAILRELIKERVLVLGQAVQFCEARSLLVSAWERFRKSGHEEDLKEAVRLKGVLLSLRGKRPGFARSLFRLDKEEKGIMKQLEEWKENDESA